MRKVLTLILIAISTLSSFLLCFQIFTKPIITDPIVKYGILAIFGLIYLIVCLLYIHTNSINKERNRSRKEVKKIRRKVVFSHIGFTLFIFITLFANYTCYTISNAISGITIDKPNVEFKDSSVSVYVLKDSPMKSLNDQFEYIGISNDDYGAIYEPVKKEMKNRYSKVLDQDYKIQKYTSIDSYVNALYNEYIQVIICEDNVYNEILEYDSNFKYKTRKLETFTISNAVDCKAVNVKKDCFNVLILGVDIRENEGTIQTNCRTDTIMVASINPKTMDVSLISVPRDSYLLIDGVYDKITHAGSKGIEYTIGAVENLLDIDINYYVKFNFDALVDVVNFVGGVEVDVKYTFDEQDSNDVPGAIHIEKGLQVLDGEEALAYARHRKTQSDNARSNAQQEVIQALLKKLISFNTVANINGLIKTLTPNMMTNFRQKDIYGLVGLAGKLPSLTMYPPLVINGENATKDVPGVKNAWVLLLSEEEIQKAKNQINAVFTSN